MPTSAAMVKAIVAGPWVKRIPVGKPQSLLSAPGGHATEYVVAVLSLERLARKKYN